MRNRSRSLTLLVIVAVVAVLVVAAVVLLRPKGSVVFVGDSITDQARPLIESEFKIDDNSLKAVGGKKIDDMQEAATGLAASKPDHAVIDLGTNDVLANEPAPPNGEALSQMVHGFPDSTCVHLVTINEHMLSPSFGNVGAAAAALNEQIWMIAQQRPKTKVIDWAKTVLDYDAEGDPNGPITVDTVHPSPMGQQLLVDAMQQSVNSC